LTGRQGPQTLLYQIAHAVDCNIYLTIPFEHDSRASTGHIGGVGADPMTDKGMLEGVLSVCEGDSFFLLIY
jgi:hypothetical protein